MKIGRLTCLLGVLLSISFCSGFYFLFVQSDDAAKGSECFAAVKRLSGASLLYAADFDARLPLRDAWQDAVAKHDDLPHDLACPLTRPGIGLAFNAKLSGAVVPADGATIPLVYDSVIPVRNASDLFTSLPTPGRHLGKDNVGYVDGHVSQVVVK